MCSTGEDQQAGGGVYAEKSLIRPEQHRTGATSVSSLLMGSSLASRLWNCGRSHRKIRSLYQRGVVKRAPLRRPSIKLHMTHPRPCWLRCECSFALPSKSRRDPREAPGYSILALVIPSPSCARAVSVMCVLCCALVNCSTYCITLSLLLLLLYLCS